MNDERRRRCHCLSVNQFSFRFGHGWSIQTKTMVGRGLAIYSNVLWNYINPIKWEKCECTKEVNKHLKRTLKQKKGNIGV